MTLAHVAPPVLPTTTATARAAAVLSLALAAAMPAAAQESDRSPFQYGGSLTIGRDSNVARAPSNAARSDTFGIVGLRVGFDQPISRQRLFGDLSLNTKRYSNTSSLDAEGYAATLGLDWSTIARLSGSLRVDANQQQAELSAVGGPVIDNRNDERAQQFQAIGRWGAQSLLQVEASYVFNRLDYSNALAAFRKLEQDTVGLRVIYSPSAFLSLGVGARAGEGDYPRFFTVSPGVGSPLDFERRDVDFTVTYVPTGLTRLDGRLSSTRVDYRQDPARDVSGVTGSLTWAYRPGGRIGLNTTLFRETGAAASFLDVGAAGRSPSGSTSQISTGLRVGATYELTGKIRLNAGVEGTRRTYTGAQAGDETLQALRFGATWAYSRAITFACGLSYETRDGNAPGVFDYSANTTQCSAQLLLR